MLEESKVEGKEHEYGLLVDMPVLVQSHIRTSPCQCACEQAQMPVATMQPRSCFFAYDIVYEQFTVMDTKGGMVMRNVNNTCTWRCAATAMVSAGAAPGLFAEGNNNSTPQRPMMHSLVYHHVQCLERYPPTSGISLRS